MLTTMLAMIQPIASILIRTIVCKLFGFVTVPVLVENAEDWLAETEPLGLWNPDWHIRDGKKLPSGFYPFRTGDSWGWAFCTWKSIKASDDDSKQLVVNYVGRPLDIKVIKKEEKESLKLKSVVKRGNTTWCGYKLIDQKSVGKFNPQPQQECLIKQMKNRRNILVVGTGGCGKSRAIEEGCIKWGHLLCRVSLDSPFSDVKAALRKAKGETVCFLVEEFETILKCLKNVVPINRDIRPSVQTKGDLFTLLDEVEKPYTNHYFVMISNLNLTELRKEMNGVDRTMFASFFRRFPLIMSIGMGYQTLHTKIYLRYRGWKAGVRKHLKCKNRIMVDDSVLETQQYVHFELPKKNK